MNTHAIVKYVKLLSVCSSKPIVHADLSYGSSDDSLTKNLQEAPLASPTTDAAVEQASRNAHAVEEQSNVERGISPSPLGQEQPQLAQDPNAAGRWTLPPPPPKPPVFTYVHDDSDTAMSELEEFFS